jgi:cob(I)alamin adenosyltransferase
MTMIFVTIFALAFLAAPTDAVTIAAMTAIASVATLISSVLNSRKLTQIHTLTNSNLSKVKTQLDVANAKIDGFKDFIALLISEAASTAEAARNAAAATERRATERQQETPK